MRVVKAHSCKAEICLAPCIDTSLGRPVLLQSERKTPRQLTHISLLSVLVLFSVLESVEFSYLILQNSLLLVPSSTKGRKEVVDLKVRMKMGCVRPKGRDDVEYVLIVTCVISHATSEYKYVIGVTRSTQYLLLTRDA